MTNFTAEPSTRFKWGQQSAMILLAAFAGAYHPVWLVYVGLARFAWCALGGEFGKGLLSLFAFTLAWLFFEATDQGLF